MSMVNDQELLTDSPAASSSDARREGLARLDRIVWLLDELFEVPIINKRIGLDPLIGLIPWAGDAIGMLLGLYIVGSAVWYRLPKIVVLRMGLNVIADAVIGMIPYVGDASDFFIKSNRWNLDLLRKYADFQRQPGLSDYLFVGFVLALVITVVGVILLVLGGTIFALYRLAKETGAF